ncbi:MAG: hypothetical protein EBT04_02330 [Betaproteobacteria bacterium]|nr:hypothetical protein [Betaproteobacteria bacterium]
MARTIGNCVAEARSILQDTAPPYRYAEVDLYVIFNSAMSETRRLRPDLFMASLFDPPIVYLSTNSSSPFPISESYYIAVVNYIVGRAELRDDQFNADNRASALLSAFKAQLSSSTA